MNPDEQHVSTEAQRQALEAMSADLVRKLNIMIQEQEQRAREFAATHHSMLPTPAAPYSTPQTTAPQQGSPAQSYTQVTPPPLAAKQSHTPPPAPTSQPTRRNTPHRATQQKKPAQEESNLGMGIIIFALAGIFMLMRSCT